MKQITQTPDTINLIVQREGIADEAYYANLKAIERSERLATTKDHVIDVLRNAGRQTARTVGIFMLDSYAGYYDSVNNSNTRQEIRQELGVSWLPRLSSTS